MHRVEAGSKSARHWSASPADRRAECARAARATHRRPFPAPARLPTSGLRSAAARSVIPAGATQVAVPSAAPGAATVRCGGWWASARRRPAPPTAATSAAPTQAVWPIARGARLHAAWPRCQAGSPPPAPGPHPRRRRSAAPPPPESPTAWASYAHAHPSPARPPAATAPVPPTRKAVLPAGNGRLRPRARSGSLLHAPRKAASQSVNGRLRRRAGTVPPVRSLWEAASPFASRCLRRDERSEPPVRSFWRLVFLTANRRLRRCAGSVQPVRLLWRVLPLFANGRLRRRAGPIPPIRSLRKAGSLSVNGCSPRRACSVAPVHAPRRAVSPTETDRLRACLVPLSHVLRNAVSRSVIGHLRRRVYSGRPGHLAADPAVVHRPALPGAPSQLHLRPDHHAYRNPSAPCRADGRTSAAAFPSPMRYRDLVSAQVVPKPAQSGSHRRPDRPGVSRRAAGPARASPGLRPRCGRRRYGRPLRAGGPRRSRVR